MQSKVAAIELGYQPDEMFLLKISQLRELFVVRWTVFLLGPAGCGKTAIWRTLMRTQACRCERHVRDDLEYAPVCATSYLHMCRSCHKARARFFMLTHTCTHALAECLGRENNLQAHQPQGCDSKRAVREICANVCLNCMPVRHTHLCNAGDPVMSLTCRARTLCLPAYTSLSEQPCVFETWMDAVWCAPLSKIRRIKGSLVAHAHTLPHRSPATPVADHAG
eukprot:1161047-Pelagomonas_calceolata.AAC.31